MSSMIAFAFWLVVFLDKIKKIGYNKIKVKDSQNQYNEVVLWLSSVILLNHL